MSLTSSWFYCWLFSSANDVLCCILIKYHRIYPLSDREKPNGLFIKVFQKKVVTNTYDSLRHMDWWIYTYGRIRTQLTFSVHKRDQLLKTKCWYSVYLVNAIEMLKNSSYVFWVFFCLFTLILVLWLEIYHFKTLNIMSH